MEMYERIKYLRKECLHKTQAEFSKSIKISRSNLGSIEIGRIKVTDRVISDICSTYNVNEKWLRTGEGGIFVKLTAESELGKYIADVLSCMDEFIKNLIISYMKLDDKSKKIILDFIKNLGLPND